MNYGKFRLYVNRQINDSCKFSMQGITQIEAAKELTDRLKYEIVQIGLWFV